MPDITRNTTWQDSPSTSTPVRSTRLEVIENNTLQVDQNQKNRIRWGTMAARPAANTVDPNTLYFVFDLNGGTWTRSDGTTWTVAGPAVLQYANGRLGYVELAANYDNFSPGADTDVPGMTLNVTASGRPLRITAAGVLELLAGGSTGTPFLKIQEGATPIATLAPGMPTFYTLATGVRVHVHQTVWRTPAAGAVTYKLVMPWKGSSASPPITRVYAGSPGFGQNHCFLSVEEA